MNALFSVSIFSVVLTLAVYQFGTFLQKKLRSPLCNPILISVILIALFLKGSGMPLEVYQNGTASISWLMTPATVCLAIPMYEQYRELRKNLMAILAGILAGTAACLVMVLGLCLIFGFSDTLTISLLPKSITSAIGAPLAELAGGSASVCTAAIIFTGILGNMLGPVFCKMFRITDPVAQGVAFGTSAHVIGTTRANELSPLIGAVSSLSLVIAGLLTAMILPVIYQVL